MNVVNRALGVGATQTRAQLNLGDLIPFTSGMGISRGITSQLRYPELAVATYQVGLFMKSRRIASLPMYAYREDRAGEREALPSWLVRPQPFNNTLPHHVVQQIITGIELEGEAFMLTPRNEQTLKIEGMYAVDPRFIWHHDAMVTSMYELNVPGSAQSRLLSVMDVLHFRDRLAGSDSHGNSPTKLARPTIDASLELEELSKTMTQQGFNAFGVVEFTEGKINAKGLELFYKTFNQRHGAMDNAGKVAVIAGGTFRSVPFNAKDAQLVEARVNAARQAGRLSGTPGVLWGDNNGASMWGSGLAQIIQGWIAFELDPITHNIEQTFNWGLWTERPDIPDERQLKIAFDLEYLKRTDVFQVRADIRDMYRAGLLTANQARIELGYTGVDDAFADQLLQPNWMLPSDIAISDKALEYSKEEVDVDALKQDVDTIKQNLTPTP